MNARISRKDVQGVRMIAGGLAAWPIACLIVMSSSPENFTAIKVAYVIITAGACLMNGGLWRQNAPKVLSISATFLFLGLAFTPAVYTIIASIATT